MVAVCLPQVAGRCGERKEKEEIIQWRDRKFTRSINPWWWIVMGKGAIIVEKCHNGAQIMEAETKIRHSLVRETGTTAKYSL